MDGAKQVVPQAQGYAKVDPVFDIRWQVLGMVPAVHLRIVEEVLERAQRDPDIGMIEMPDAQGDDVHHEKLLDAKADHPQWNIFDRTVDDIFHPVIPQVCREAKLLGGVVHFMEIPQPGDTVEQAMDVPLDKIPYDKHGQQLRPNRPSGNLYRDEVSYPEYIGQEIIERLDKDTRDSVVPDQREKEEVEEHIEHIQPELACPRTLFLLPWPEIFQRKEKEGYPDQPIEVIVPRRGRDLMVEVIGIPSIGIDKDF